MSAWESFFVTAGGAAAVLAGLIFIGISINLQKLLERTLVSRGAWVSLLTLVEVLIVSLLMLIPEQPLPALGAEVGGVGLMCWIVMTIVTIHQFKHARQDGFLEGQTWYGRLVMLLLHCAICDRRSPTVARQSEWCLLDVARDLVCVALLTLYGMGLDG
jgi:hypothetical protein